VLLVGLEEFQDDCWSVLVDAGIRLERADDVAGALRALNASPIPVVIAAVPWAESLVSSVRRQRELASTHVVVAAALDSPDGLRAALDAGADDVIRVTFEPEVLVARVAAGLAPRAYAPTRRCCARWWTTSRVPCIGARATAIGRCTG